MPVYRKHGLIHIHIPKTGGTAIEKLFHARDDMVWGKESWLGQEQHDGRWYEYQHLTLSEFRQFTGSAFKTYRSFAVVRNPYTRLISDFRWRNPNTGNPNSPLLSFPSFDAFIGSIPKDMDSNWPNLIGGADKRRANFLIHVRPQHHYVETQHDDIGVDRVVRFENFDGEMAEFLCGIETSELRKPPSPTLKEFYTRETLDAVNRLYKKDFALFGYERL